MAKFMVLYSASIAAQELMAKTSPEQMKASMGEWMEWKAKAEATPGVKVEFGMPLQAVNKVTQNGVTDSESNASGYSILEADSKDVVLELLKTHPHLKRPDASIDVLEFLSMPGLDV